MWVNKKQCAKCKYHGYFGSKSYGTSDATFGRSIICDYVKYTNRTCLHSVHGKVVDRRGTDPDNCLFFEHGERPKGSGFNGEPRKEKK